MKRLLAASTLLLGLSASPVWAQSAQPAAETPTTAPMGAPPTGAVQATPRNPALVLHRGDTLTTTAPVAGHNSFTEKQAAKRLRGHGYRDVSMLKLDEHSVWRGTAMKDGRTVNVAVDYQGNIVTQ